VTITVVFMMLIGTTSFYSFHFVYRLIVKKETFARTEDINSLEISFVLNVSFVYFKSDVVIQCILFLSLIFVSLYLILCTCLKSNNTGSRKTQ